MKVTVTGKHVDMAEGPEGRAAAVAEADSKAR